MLMTKYGIKFHKTLYMVNRVAMDASCSNDYKQPEYVRSLDFVSGLQSDSKDRRSAGPS